VNHPPWAIASGHAVLDSDRDGRFWKRSYVRDAVPIASYWVDSR
jgi:hypothetical protein